MTSFDTDPFPGRPKLLLIANGYSSHLHDWVDLLKDARFNIRVFAVPHTFPPYDWPVKTYITGLSHTAAIPESDTRQRMYPIVPKKTDPTWLPKTLKYRHLARGSSPEQWLAEIVRAWQPDIIQTLSISPASKFYYEAYKRFNLKGIGKWMLMIYGGTDIELERVHPKHSQYFREIITAADYVFGDTEHCIIAARDLGLSEAQIPRYYKFPGAGGVNVDEIVAQWRDNPPSKRRMLLWPKAYDGYYVISHAVFEALTLCWDDIQPCELVIPGMKEYAGMWFYKLPERIRDATQIPAHMSHDEFRALMLKARVMLAPSLLDGLPNVLPDAMASGAFPIVSPIDHLQEFMKDEENTLFAHNLYPQQIADAITRAMNDDALVDSAAQNNIEVVRRIADRDTIRQQVVQIYEEVAQKL